MADESPPDAKGPPSSWNLDDPKMRRLLSELRRAPRALDDPPTTELSEDLGSVETLGPFRDHETGLDADPARELGEGSRVGRFLLERELGRGGFGVVYLALDESLGRRVALKTPRPDRVQNAALWRRFAREARLAAALDHPAIVPALEAGVAGGVAYIASAYQEGRTLSYWIAKRKGGFPTKFAAGIAEQLASGLVHAHQRGVLHRDLKPGNVILGGSPPKPGAPFPPASEVPARITDFGLGSFDLGDDEVTQTGFWMGSPPYMAPEQALGGGRPIDTRADIYALGAVLYEMLTGRPIYSCRELAELAVRLGRGETPPRPRQLRREIPRDLETICLKCLAFDPAKRYPSSAVLLDDLRRQMDGRPITARRAPAPERLARWACRHPSRAALIGVLVVGAAVGQALMLRHHAALSDSNVRLEKVVKQLADSLNQLDGAKRRLQTTFDDLQAHDARLQREVYASALTTADSFLAAGDKESAQLTLLRQLPDEDRPDLREFAWSYLWKRATREFSTHPLTRDAGWHRSGVGPVLVPNWWTGPAAVTAREANPDGFIVDRLGPRLDLHWLSYLPYRNGLYAKCVDGKTVWIGEGAVEPAVLPGRGGKPCLSPSGEILALADWERLLPTLEKPPKAVRERQRLPWGREIDVIRLPAAIRATFSADGQTVALLTPIPGSAEYAPLIYDLKTGRGWTFPQHPRPARVSRVNNDGNTIGFDTAFALSADGARLAMGGDQERLAVIDARDGRALWLKTAADGFGPEEHVQFAVFSSDGRRLVVCDGGGRVLLWDVETGDRIAEAPFSPQASGAVGFYPDDEAVIAFSHFEDRVRSWPLSAPASPPMEFDHGTEVWGLVFIPGSRLLASAGDDHMIRLWDLDRGESRATLSGHQTLVTQLAVSPDGRTLVSGDYRGHLRVWDPSALDAPPKAPPHSFDRIRALSWSPNGRYLAAAGDVDRLRVWDRETDHWTSISMPSALEFNYGLAWSPDGSMLAAGGGENSIFIWTWPNGAFWRSITSQVHVVTSLLFTRDGPSLIASAVGGDLRSWSLDHPERPRIRLEHNSRPGGIWGLTLSPDGRTLAGGRDDGQVFLWDSETLQQTCQINVHQDKVRALAFSPDGQKLATADFEGKILIHSGLETVGPLQLPGPRAKPAK